MHILMILSKKNAIGDVYDALSKMPNSARGELSVTWKGHNGGHSLAWEVINNKPVIFDFQTHKVYETPDKFSEIANMFDGLSPATSCRSSSAMGKAQLNFWRPNDERAKV